MHLLIIIHCICSSCDGKPLIPSSFHIFWWIPTLLQINVFTLVLIIKLHVAQLVEPDVYSLAKVYHI